jgi:hypothetical protein
MGWVHSNHFFDRKSSANESTSYRIYREELITVDFHGPISNYELKSGNQQNEEMNFLKRNFEILEYQ